jgi:hypothetical protein
VISGIVAAGVMGYSLGKLPVAILMSLVLAILAAGVLLADHRRSAIPLIAVAVLMLALEPRLASHLDATRGFESLTAVGASLGGLLLAATLLLHLRRSKLAAALAPPAVVNRPQRSVTYDLLLTTVSRIPTFVNRLRPLRPEPATAYPAAPRSDKISSSQEKVSSSGAVRTPADFVCRALPTPHEEFLRRPPAYRRHNDLPRFL